MKNETNIYTVACNLINYINESDYVYDSENDVIEYIEYLHSNNVFNLKEFDVVELIKEVKEVLNGK
jgi:hypothetical protein